MLLVAACWRTNRAVADQVIDNLGPKLALQPRRLFTKDVVLIVEHLGVHPRSQGRRAVEELPALHQPPGSHRRRYPLVVEIGRTVPGNCSACLTLGGIRCQAAVGDNTTIADGGCPGSGLMVPHCRRRGEELPAWNTTTTSRTNRSGRSSSTPSPA